MHMDTALTIPAAQTDYLPGTRQASQHRHTFTMHTPAFATLSALRRNIRERLVPWRLTPACMSDLQFTVSEVITNLVKHPPRKATTVRVTLSAEGNQIAIDISDDSTPFATFIAECNTSRRRLTQRDELHVGGYGIGCLIELLTDMHYTPANLSLDGWNHFTAKMAKHVTAPVRTAAVQKKETLNSNFQAAHAGDKKTPLICLIDDNAVTLNLYKSFLEQHYNVHTYTYATDALASFKNRMPDVIIADLSLTDMDGVAFRHRLSDIDGGSQIPFVFLSSHNNLRQEIDANLTGIDDFLCKPVSSDRMLSVVNRLIRRSYQIASCVQGSFDRKLNSMLHPELPHTAHNWRIATRSSRAEAGGGDFILYQNETDRLFGVVADVMGHGRDAKFFSCAYAGYLRSFIQALRSEEGPAHFLEKLSAAIHSDNFFNVSPMTCLAFELCTEGLIKLSIAGHPPPSFCMSKSGISQAKQLDIAGPLPGLIAANHYQQVSLKLEKGERLLMATDGYWAISERREALHSALEMAAVLDVERAADALWQAHIDHSRASLRPQDDTTLILLEAGGAR